VTYPRWLFRGELFSVLLAVAVMARPAPQAESPWANGSPSNQRRPILVVAQDNIDGFVARSYVKGRETMPYRLFTPQGYDRQKTYPLIIWLHGGGGVGDDNRRQIVGDQIPGTRTWTDTATQAKHPAFVLVPQSAQVWSAHSLDLVVEILDALSHESSIDPHRIYVAGQSIGGIAVWDLITRKPERFAAAILVCGGGDPVLAGRVAKMPIWVFHGDIDRVIPVTAGRQVVAAVQKAGGSPRYTEYKGAGHDIWTRAFAEPGLVDWLFAQRR
jgi:predicted peptidase